MVFERAKRFLQIIVFESHKQNLEPEVKKLHTIDIHLLLLTFEEMLAEETVSLPSYGPRMVRMMAQELHFPELGAPQTLVEDHSYSVGKLEVLLKLHSSNASTRLQNQTQAELKYAGLAPTVLKAIRSFETGNFTIQLLLFAHAAKENSALTLHFIFVDNNNVAQFLKDKFGERATIQPNGDLALLEPVSKSISLFKRFGIVSEGKREQLVFYRYTESDGDRPATQDSKEPELSFVPGLVTQS